MRQHVFTQTPKKKERRELIKPRYLKAFPPHHLQRKALLVDLMLHNVICWRLRPSLDSLDHLSDQNCGAQQAWEIGKVSTLKYLKSGVANLRDVTRVLPSYHQITKPSNTHASARDQSTRVLCHCGHDVTQQNHGLCGSKRYTNLMHLPLKLYSLAWPWTSSKLARGSVFSTPEKAWKSVLLPKQLLYVYIQLRSPYLCGHITCTIVPI